MRLLFVENEDSFSWNVIESLPCTRAEVELCAGRHAVAGAAALADFDAVVVGPGPRDPLRAGLIGLVRTVALARCPLLGICLGHQALGLAFGARLRRADPVHGKQTTVRFGPSRLFPGFEGPQSVMRYNSLVLDHVQAPLRVVARCPDGTPMAIEHEELPLGGLQFHPDSYATPRGLEMIAAFFEAVGR